MQKRTKKRNTLELVREVARELGWNTALVGRDVKDTTFCFFSISCPYVGEMQFGVDVRESDTICDVSLKVDKHLGKFDASTEAHNLVWVDYGLRLDWAMVAMDWYEGQLEELAMALNQAY